MTSTSESQLREGASALGVTLSEAQIEQFRQYAALLAEWNERMNLTRIPAERTVGHHFLDSLSIARAREPKGKVLDVGTGAGFPGLALKIAFPGIELTVLDSVKKKLSFIDEVARRLGIRVTALGIRAEEAAHSVELRESFDLVTSRAVAELEQLCHWTLPFAKVGGSVVAMKGPGYESELEPALQTIEALGGKLERSINIKIPTTELLHTLIIIAKVSPTPPELPRRGNVKKR